MRSAGRPSFSAAMAWCEDNRASPKTRRSSSLQTLSKRLPRGQAGISSGATRSVATQDVQVVRLGGAQRGVSRVVGQPPGRRCRHLEAQLSEIQLAHEGGDPPRPTSRCLTSLALSGPRPARRRRHRGAGTPEGSRLAASCRNLVTPRPNFARLQTIAATPDQHRSLPEFHIAAARDSLDPLHSLAAARRVEELHKPAAVLQPFNQAEGKCSPGAPRHVSVSRSQRQRSQTIPRIAMGGPTFSATGPSRRRAGSARQQLKSRDRQPAAEFVGPEAVCGAATQHELRGRWARERLPVTPRRWRVSMAPRRPASVALKRAQPQAFRSVLHS